MFKWRKTVKVFSLLGMMIFTLAIDSQNTLKEKYKNGSNLLKSKKYYEAYLIFKNIESKCNKDDTIYKDILWNYTTATSLLVNKNLKTENWEQSLEYGIEALNLINKGKKIFSEPFGSRIYWMYKNLIVSYFGLGQLNKAKIYQDKLYEAYRGKKLPKGIDHFYNFEFFKWKGKNIWGYEWYPELGDPETRGTFSKIVYYIFSTNSEGNDTDQLYRLHVLKFHKFNNSVNFDYVLTKRIEKEKHETSKTLYSYTYQKTINYEKLRNDIRKVLKGNHKSETKSVIKKNYP